MEAILVKNDLFNDRISRFSIRKLNVGVCSVLLGTLVMLGTATGVAAEEVAENKQTDEVAVTTEKEQPESLSTSQAEKEDATTYQATPVVPVATETKLELDQTRLQAYIAEIEANLANGKYSNKTDESIDALKASLDNAKNALASAESQAELDAAYQSLVTTVNAKLKNKVVAESKPVVEAKAEVTEKTEESIGKPAANTQPAEGTNAIANTGQNDPRNGKEINKNTAFRADTTTSGIGADVEDATSTPKVEKPGFTTDLDAKSLTSQITWLDFGDVANWTGAKTVLVPKNDAFPDKNLEEKLALQVGATYTKEIMPGYVVTVKVKSLKPFQATEIYKKRMENQGATEAEKATYDPNAKNGYVSGVTSTGAKKAFNDGMEADVVADAQNNWTEIRFENVDTKTKKTTMSSAMNGGNIGVQFEISATFRGKTVKPAIVMADGESANPGEFVMFTTNGEGWQHLGEWKKFIRPTTSVTYSPQDTENLFGSTPKYNNINLRQLRDSNQVGPDKKPVAWKYFGNPDQVTGGLGTGIFGPNISAGNYTVPIVVTRGASEVGLYIASGGKQSAMLGFFPIDEGDAPESYGKAMHTIATVDGVTGAKVNQPYIGNVSPDMDENTTLDWFGDDKATTADEGINQLLPDELKGTTNEMIKMDRTRPGNYKLSIQAHTDGASEAYIYGWIDFNQNGIFDEDERSDLARITNDGTVELTFAKSKTYIDPSVKELGARVRIAKKATEIESPTGMAFSGEVEDFRTQITHPPKGEFKETSGLQGAKQTATVTFTARGEHKYELNSSAVIDETVEPYIVDKDGNRATLDADGYYVVPGQGKYKITANGKDVDVEFIPEDNFIGTADGISIRRSDNNGYDTGWSTKFPDQEPNINGQLNTMDGQYVPTVTPIEIEGVDKTSTDVQGATQIGTPEFELEGTNSNGEKVKVAPDFDYPAKFVSPTTGKVINDPVVTLEGEGIYYLDDLTGKVTFVPEPGFTGTAKGVTVSLTAPVGRDKNKQVQSEFIKTATAKYIPTVTPVTIAPTNKVSEDVQNVPQTQTPIFELSNDKATKITSKKLVDPMTGQPTNETSVTVAGEGTYTIDPTTGAVTFTPEKDFVGTATGVTVQATATITNANGKISTITSDATYTPTVVAAVPTASPATSKDIQGATQTGRPTFTGTTVQVNGEDKAITIKDNSYTLLDKDGNEVATTPAYAADGTTEIGTFTINPATGQVTFTPTDKSYTGAVTPAKVQAESSNGIKVDTTYTPEIVPVTPTATPAKTTDIQGATQTGKPEFKGGTVTVDGVEKTVAINEDVPATFDDGSTTKTVDGVGTYTVASDGTVTFVPEKSFTGKAPSVTVIREDKNGTKASATYTPTVTPVTPTAEDTTSTGKQGQTQTGRPTFTEGDSRVPMNDDVPATFDDGSTTKTVDGVGTYTVAADGTVTFVPKKSFTGTAPAVTVVREDKNGTKASATYTPTVTPVTPTASPAESEAPQGLVQTGTVTFTEGDPVVPIDKDTITLLDENGQPAASVDAKSPEGKVIGTFTVDKDTSVVTFTPTDKSYSGDVVSVKVQAKDVNGTAVETTYTPKITPVTPTATPATSTDIQGQTQTGKPKFTEGNVRVPMDDDTPATFDDGSTTKVIPGEGTYTVAPDGTVTFVPEKTFTGTGTGVTVKRVDKNGTAVTTKYTPTVTPVVPSATPAVSEDVQGATQTGKPEFTAGNSRVPMNDAVPTTFDDGSKTKTVDGVGTYTVATDGTVTFVPEPSFTGTAPAVTVVREDMNGTKASATYTPTVNPVTVTPTNKVSEDVQNVPQTETPTFDLSNDKTAQITSKKLVDPTTGQPTDDATVTVAGEGSYTIDPTTWAVTFTPEKDFVGTAKGVTVQATATITNENGKTATIISDATYTPTVVAAVPTAQPAKSKDIQGATQTGTPTFAGTTVQVNGQDKPVTIKSNSYKLLDKDGNEVTTTPAYATDGITVIGNFSIDPATGTVTFTPTDKSYTGAVTPAKVQAESSNGIKVDTIYTPEIVPVTPTATPTETTDIQGATQKGKPEFQGGTVNVDGVDKTVAINEAVPATFEDGSTTKTVGGVGTYTVAADGTVTFVPEKSFVGTAPAVTVVREDMNGTKASATYTPTVTPVTPTAEPATSTDKQGQTQTGKPEFTEGNSRVPMDDTVPATFDDGSTTKIIPGEGTYTVAPDGIVTFVPEKSFTGTGTGVTVKRVDKNGTPVTAKYTPTVTPVTPTATPAESVAPQGLVQTGTVTFTEGDPVAPIDKDTITLLDENGQPAASVDAKSPEGKVIGTFTVDKETGVVTFTPTDKSYSGDVVPVKVQAKDANGTTVETTYTPKITPVVPTGEDVTSTDIQGQTQTGKPKFTEGDPSVPMDDAVPATFDDGTTTKTVDGVGTYTVAADGTVTFVPEKSFVGTAPAVTVVREDMNGTKASATYTPTVTPVTPTAKDTTSTGKQGQTQTGKPTFTAGNPNVPMDDDTPATFEDGSTTKTIPGEGTYTVAPDGTVTFVPEKTFTGTGTGVTVKRVDKNGTPATAKYTPTVTPVIPTATRAESEAPQGLVQTGTVTFTEGDPVVPIDKDTITLLDENGQPAASVDAKSPEGKVIGTFTVDKDTSVVTFTPTDKSYSGDVVSVKVQAKDTNGTPAETTYTPKITPVVPTSEDATSTNIQGATQTDKPVFTEGDSRVPMNDDVPATFDDGSTTKTVDGEGTYTVSPDGTVTFVPEKSFTGTGTGVTVKRVDKNGTEITAKYTPTVTPVTPTAIPAESTGPQGVVQAGTVTFTEGDPVVPIDKDVVTLLDENGQPATSVDAKSPEGKVVGTFTVDKKTGVVTFTPTDKSYSGDVVPVKVQAADTNRTTVETTYTPKITPVVPTSEDATSTDIQGSTQTGKPVFTEGNSRVPMNNAVPATFDDGSTTKTVDGVGTYTVAADGTVTFVPEKSFVGIAPAVTVVREDKNGTKASATYTPTVTPVTPTATPVESTDIQGATQTGKPVFTEGDSRVPMNDAVPATFDDGSTTKTVDGVGTYTVAADGTVTFVPEPSFTGTAPAVTVVREDMNGTEASATYTPTVTPITVTPTDKVSEDVQNVPQTQTPTFDLSSDKTAQITSKKLVDPTTGQPTDATTMTVAGEGTYTIDPTTGAVTFTPEKDFVGIATGVTVQATATITNAAGKTATITSDATYTPTVVAAVPTAQPATSKDIQGATQTGTPTFAGTTVQVNGEDKAITIKDNSYTLLDNDGNEVTSTPAYAADGTTEIGTYSIDSATGQVTFTPTDKSYTGAVTPAKVQAESSNGIKVDTTYTPEIVPVSPTATPAETTDIQGATQTGKPVFTEGDSRVPMNDDVPATFSDGSTTKTVDGVGTYTVAADGTVTFVPEKSFVGTTPAVTVVREDMNGTKASATYTPTVTPVTPTATPAESTDIQGTTQTGKPTFKEGDSRVPMNNDVPATFDDGSTTKTISGVGTYTVAADGTVTFVPEKSFTGTGTGVTVKRVDKNGTEITAKYTPTVTPVTPTATPVETTGKQGQTQTGKPEFTEGDSRVPMNDAVPATFDDGSTTKTVDGVGTYTVAADGKVTFVPEKSFTGKAPAVTVVREDKNGTKASATYTPTVTPVTPIATPVETTGKQDQTQTGKPEFTEGDSRVPMNDDVPATFDDGSTTKTVDGVGTYTVAADGTVTFVPERSFTGKAPAVTVVREDKNGTKASATYTPTVIPVTPTATPAESTGPQGLVQTGTVTFAEGDPVAPIDKDTITLLDKNGQPAISVEAKSPEGKVVGTFTVDKATGVVTFTPTDKTYSGDVVAVKVQAKDANGTPAETTYTPKITPVTPTGEPATTIGPKGQEQSGKPTFKEGDSRVPMNDDVPATFDDGSTIKTIPGVGTYTVAADGTITFKPEHEFTGTAPSVTVVREDMNGTKASATYTPTVTPVTTFVDKEGNSIPGYPSEDGEQPKKEIPGYRFVETKKLPNGDTEHVYEQVKTSFKDKEGKEIPGYPSEDGEQPKKAIPGYRFVETKKLPNGDTEHVYEKITTSYVDENGNPIPGYPTENGEQPKKEISGYEFVKTVVDKDGNIQHIYKKVVTPNPVPTPDSKQTPDPVSTPEPKPIQVPETPRESTPVNETVAKTTTPQLPNTGTEDHASLAALGLLGVLSGFGLMARKKKED